MTRSTEWAVEAHGLVKVFGDNRAVDEDQIGRAHV